MTRGIGGMRAFWVKEPKPQKKERKMNWEKVVERLRGEATHYRQHAIDNRYHAETRQISHTLSQMSEVLADALEAGLAEGRGPQMTPISVDDIEAEAMIWPARKK